MCQACLALASRRSGSSGWPLGAGEAAPARGRFAAEWTDEPVDGDAAAVDDGDRPIDAPRGRRAG